MVATRILTAAGSALTAALALAACGSSDTGGSAGNGPTVSAKEYMFTPADTPVQASQSVTVTFRNNGTTQHSMTLDNGSGEVETGPGTSKTLTITTPQSGSLTFHCKYHPNRMHGSFTVGAGGGAQPTQSTTTTTGGGGYGY